MKIAKKTLKNAFILRGPLVKIKRIKTHLESKFKS